MVSRRNFKHAQVDVNGKDWYPECFELWLNALATRAISGISGSSVMK